MEEKPVYILGISCFYHDSSACLIKNGEIIAAVQEERFTRKKHDHSFPENAIKFCLEKAKIKIQDVDKIGFYEKPIQKFDRYLNQHLQSFPNSYKMFLENTPSWIGEKLHILKKIKKIGYKKPVIFIEHHLAHAAGTFLTSPFKESAILTIDGVGEWTTTSYGTGESDEIKLVKQIKFPHSLGLLYSTITAFLGFEVNEAEFKIMGLSAYGNKTFSNKYYKKFKEIIEVKDDGSYRLNMKFFEFHKKGKMFSKELIKILGTSRKTKEKISARHKDIAAALQMITEEIYIKILNHIQKETKQKNICISGGVALNSVANGLILEKTKFENVWIQPNSSDGGTSLGVAIYIYNSLYKPKNQDRFYLKNEYSDYLGPEFSNNEIRKILEKANIKFESLSREELTKKVAKLLSQDKIIGWFQGKMEFGPRALGNRSILANASNPKMKDHLNSKIKFREDFRPFAPATLKEKANTILEIKSKQKPTDFMLMTFKAKEEWKNKISSALNVDGSGRIQTLSKKQNALFYDLIKEFERINKIPILINTSFNIRGEPIVCTPEEAYNCFKKTDMDFLVIGSLLISKD